MPPRAVGIDAKTLRKHYRDEIDTGATKATAKVAEFLYRKATSDGPQCVTAAIFWLKTRAGWKEPLIEEGSLPPPKLIISWNPAHSDVFGRAEDAANATSHPLLG